MDNKKWIMLFGFGIILHKRWIALILIGLFLIPISTLNSTGQITGEYGFIYKQYSKSMINTTANTPFTSQLINSILVRNVSLSIYTKNDKPNNLVLCYQNVSDCNFTSKKYLSVNTVSNYVNEAYIYALNATRFLIQFRATSAVAGSITYLYYRAGYVNKNRGVTLGTLFAFKTGLVGTTYYFTDKCTCKINKSDFYCIYNKEVAGIQNMRIAYFKTVGTTITNLYDDSIFNTEIGYLKICYIKDFYSSLVWTSTDNNIITIGNGYYVNMHWTSTTGWDDTGFPSMDLGVCFTFDLCRNDNITTLVSRQNWDDYNFLYLIPTTVDDVPYIIDNESLGVNVYNCYVSNMQNNISIRTFCNHATFLETLTVINYNINYYYAFNTSINIGTLSNEIKPTVYGINLTHVLLSYVNLTFKSAPNTYYYNGTVKILRLKQNVISPLTVNNPNPANRTIYNTNLIMYNTTGLFLSVDLNFNNWLWLGSSNNLKIYFYVYNNTHILIDTFLQTNITYNNTYVNFSYKLNETNSLYYWNITVYLGIQKTPLYKSPLYNFKTSSPTPITLYENLVDVTGTHEYNLNETGYNVWANYTGTGGGGPTPIHLFENLLNVTGTHEYNLNIGGYNVWANYTGDVTNTSGWLNLSSVLSIDNSQLFLVIFIMLWTYFISKYYDTKKTIFTIAQLLIGIPLSIMILGISYINNLVYGYLIGLMFILLTLLIPVLSYLDNKKEEQIKKKHY